MTPKQREKIVIKVSTQLPNIYPKSGDVLDAIMSAVDALAGIIEKRDGEETQVVKSTKTVPGMPGKPGEHQSSAANDDAGKNCDYASPSPSVFAEPTPKELNDLVEKWRTTNGGIADFITAVLRLRAEQVAGKMRGT